MTIPMPCGSRSWYAAEVSSIRHQADNLDVGVLKLGLVSLCQGASTWADSKQILTIIGLFKTIH